MATATAQGIKWQRGKIVEPGIYNNLPLDTYHRPDICDGVSISSSGLRAIFNESPAHFWARSPLNQHRIKEPTPRHFAIGRAMHHLAMGMTAFEKEFAVAPKYARNKEGKLVEWSLRTDWAKAWVAQVELSGKTYITREELEQIRGMSEALAADGFVRGAGVLEGVVERSGFWRDKETGVWLKIRPDVIPTHKGGEMVDLKTCASVQWPDLLRAVEEHGYDMQFALMREVLKNLKMPFTAAALVFVEKKPPHCVRVVELHEEDLDAAEEKVRRALRKFAVCYRSGKWPGPAGFRSDAEPIRFTDAARDRAERKLKIMREEEDHDRRAGASFRV